MKFSILTEEEYCSFQLSHPNRDFMSSIKAMKLKKINNWDVEYVGVKENETIICATALTSIPVMKVYNFFYAQRGFLIDYENQDLLAFFTRELKGYLKKRNGLYLTVDPNVLYKERDIDGALVEQGFDHSNVIDNMVMNGYEHQGFSKNFQVISEIRWVFSLYLDNKSEDDLLKEMHQQTRWSINKTLKQGIQVRELAIDELDIFLKMMEHTSERCQFEQRDSSFYRNQMMVYGEDAKLLLAYLDVDKFREKLDEEKEALNLEKQEIDAKLIEVTNSKKFIKKAKVIQEALDINAKKYKDMGILEQTYGKIIPMATSFFIRFEDELVYLYSAAYDEFKKYNAPYAIQWYMLRYALAHHIRKYNFYGISGDFDKNAQDYGVYEFKKGFHGVVEELVGDFVLPIRKGTYNIYKNLKNK
ncbi:MAG: peptidoglycan bridge formation glycyltransferase FemA/FemB family protein [Longicatena sp.]